MVARLRGMVAQRALGEGRTDAAYAGLRYYRFSSPVEYHKTQILMPGLVVVVQGLKTARLHQQVLTYDALHCLILGREAACHGTVVTASAERPYLAIHLDLAPDVLVKTLIAVGDGLDAMSTAPAARAQQVVAPVDPRVLEAFTRLLPAVDDPLDRLTIAPLVLEEIIVRLLRSPAGLALREAATVRRSAANIQRSIQFIRAQYHRPLDIAELASQVAMSPSHYAHTFREVAGVSPMRYLRGLRLDEARALLVRGGLRAGEVAAQVGFESSEHFTREFRRRFGMSPSACTSQLAG
ncbi:MAG TPA: AraC family transcriptional regulator [Hydrogenophaga sp.]|nr:AraC family transcriptional regulator [Hydrogenophaga sp.]